MFRRFFLDKYPFVIYLNAIFLLIVHVNREIIAATASNARDVFFVKFSLADAENL